MSRVGKKPIIIPSGTDVTLSGQDVTVKGTKGELHQTIHSDVSIKIEDIDNDKQVIFNILDENNHKQNALWGTMRTLVANMIHGVSDGFSKKLEVNGVGYRVNVQGNTVVLNVGYSHEVRIELPAEIQGAAEGNILTISGFDKQMVGEMAARIRKIRKPEPYKGKGIKYSDEIIRRKAGKAQKSGE